MVSEGLGDTAEAILRAVSSAVIRFSTATHWEEAVPDVLANLGTASGASRLYVYQNLTDDSGRLCQDLAFEWSAPGITPTIGLAWTHGWVYGEGYAHYEDILGSGGVIQSQASEVGEVERADYAEVGILSAVFVPIFLGDEWWGYMGYDECEVERRWSSLEVLVLRTAAETLGAAIYRGRLEEKLREAEKR